MIRKFLSVITLAFGFFTFGPVWAICAPSTERVAVANQQFGEALLKNVAGTAQLTEANTNIFVSPLSASIGLSLLLNGADGATFDSVRSTLHYENLTLDEVNVANRELFARYAAPPVVPGATNEAPPFTLQLKNSLWSNSASSFRFHDAYIAAMREMYDAEARGIAFGDPGAAVAMNAWASAATEGRVTNVIDAATLADLSFVLLNATYFKANWETEFYEGNTLDAEFTRADGTNSTVRMMEQVAEFPYFETEKYQAVRLPYAESTVSMLVVMPKPEYDLASLVADSTIGSGAMLAEFRAGAEARRVQLALPKFGFAYSAALDDSLRAMGMELAFTDLADFSRLGAPSTKIDLVKQDTFVMVDEKGTEAAAVSLIGGTPTSAPIGEPADFRVNRPFLVMIVDHELDLPIFSGLVMNPEWSGKR